MAIDNREKRQAVAALPHVIFAVNVTPNASQDIEWRQEAAWGYPGISPTGPFVGEPAKSIVPRWHTKVLKRRMNDRLLLEPA